MYITWVLLAATILISLNAFRDENFKRNWMFHPYSVVHNKQWYRSFTHAFIHADYFHLIFNMFVLYSFGCEHPGSLEPSLIAEYGPKGYLYFGSLYLGGILFSTLISVAKHKDNPGYSSLGASGATMAVLFAYVLLNPHAELMLLLIPVPLPAYILAPIILAIEYFFSKRGATGIAHDAHFAGAIFGIIFMTIIDYHYLIDFFKSFGS